MIGVLACFALVMFAFSLAGNGQAIDLVEKWAIDNGYTITSRTRKLYGGSYAFRMSKTQRVHRVVVVDQDGRTRTADIRCGSYFMGMSNPKLDVTWRD
jgi:hypothetical protein